MSKIKFAFFGAVTGAVNGLFGAGGGMILVPMLTSFSELDEDAVFPASVSTILPICIVSLLFTGKISHLPFTEALPYLVGGIAGGIIVGLTGNKIPVKWLHRFLGLLILWGGVRYLWP